MKWFETKERVPANGVVAMSILRSLSATRVYIYGTIIISRYICVRISLKLEKKTNFKWFPIKLERFYSRRLRHYSRNAFRFSFLINKYIKYVIIMPTMCWCVCSMFMRRHLSFGWSLHLLHHINSRQGKSIKLFTFNSKGQRQGKRGSQRTRAHRFIIVLLLHFNFFLSRFCFVWGFKLGIGTQQFM